MAGEKMVSILKASANLRFLLIFRFILIDRNYILLERTEFAQLNSQKFTLSTDFYLYKIYLKKIGSVHKKLKNYHIE